MKVRISHCKLSKKVEKQLLQFFVAEVTARTASDLVGINRRTGTLYYQKIREVICDHLKQEGEAYFEGEVELDESYFGGKRKGKQGRGAAGKVIVFGILKRGGKVYTKVIEDTKANTLMPIIKRKIRLDSVVYTDCYRSYSTLDVSGFTTIGSTTQAILRRDNLITSTGLRTFGIKLKESYESIMMCQRNLSLFS